MSQIGQNKLRVRHLHTDITGIQQNNQTLDKKQQKTYQSWDTYEQETF